MRCGGKLSEDGFSLMKRMLQMDQDERITCEESLQHRYLAEPKRRKSQKSKSSKSKKKSHALVKLHDGMAKLFTERLGIEVVDTSAAKKSSDAEAIEAYEAFLKKKSAGAE